MWIEALGAGDDFPARPEILPDARGISGAVRDHVRRDR
jgi:hypothetical protein